MRLDSDTMTATQRVLAVVNHEEPDRVPTFLMGMPNYSDFFLEFLQRQDDPSVGFGTFTDDDANLKITPFGDLTIPYFFGHECASRGIDIEGQFRKWLGDDGILHDKFPTDWKEGRQVTYMGRVEGVKTLSNGHQYTWYIGGWLDTKEKLLAWFDEHGWPHEHKPARADLASYNEMKAKWSRDFCVFAGVGNAGLYERTWFMMGQSRFLYYARKDPEFIMKVVNALKQMIFNIVDELKQLRPPIVWMADDLGQKGRSLLSPAMHDKFFGAARREVFRKIHEEIGAKIILHSCGNAVELLPQLADWGLDGWQSLEPAADIDHAAVKKQFGDRMSFWGAIDNNVMCFGSPADVKRAVKQQIKTLGKGGGYVAGPAHDYLNVKVDNALAMRDAILEYGKYPLNCE